MKKHYIVLGLFCLLAIVACSDNDPVVEVNNDNPTEELPPLPTEVITGSRAMWVSYDPISLLIYMQLEQGELCMVHQTF